MRADKFDLGIAHVIQVPVEVPLTAGRPCRARMSH
jgi:hypothetical protein